MLPFRLFFTLVSVALVVNNLFADENKLIKIIKTKLYALEAETLLTGLKHPWCIAFLPDGSFFITEREGRLILVDNSFRTKKNISLDSIPIYATGQGGLFDVAIDKNFHENSYVYISYNGKSGNGRWGTELMRAKFLNDRLSDITVLFKMQPKSRSNHHFGGRILLNKQDELFLTLGDRGKKEEAQLLSSHHGTIVRMNTNETIPKNTPLEAQKQQFTKFSEIFSFGHRNVQGIAIHPVTSEIWAHEHGPQGGDELNLIQSGKNYGWPVITYGVNYIIGTKIGEGTKKKGMEQPIFTWIPSIGTSGLTFISGNTFKKWDNNLLIGGLKNGHLVRVALKENRILEYEEIFQNRFGRIRDVRIGKDGNIYLLTDERNGKLIRLSLVN
ncbi:PQQ-dependent sugar dehydrogenase [Betaproteobacteria bacterium]|nr:PQQ-dependent sugar dehydrogenase [Betaproteobacteria bacterium]